MNLDFKACHRFARTSHRKVRYVIDLIRGRTVNQALTDLKHDKHRASRFVEKVLASAVANALQNPEVKPNRLVVSAAYVNTGPLQFGRFRFRPGPRGRAMPIRRRRATSTCTSPIRARAKAVSAAGQARQGREAARGAGQGGEGGRGRRAGRGEAGQEIEGQGRRELDHGPKDTSDRLPHRGHRAMAVALVRDQEGLPPPAHRGSEDPPLRA
jgi:large subunit ribosomal protein L22